MSTVTSQQKQSPARSPSASRRSTPANPARLIRRVVEDAQALGRTAGEATEELRSLLRVQLEDRPYVALTVASSLGYLLAGGAPTRLGRLLWSLGSRLTLEVFVRDVVNGAAKAAGALEPGPEDFETTA
jgi:hypothetical protein